MSVNLPRDITPASLAELQDILKEPGRLRLCGGGSKTALSAPLDGFTTLHTRALRGMLSYQPGEFTFTALAGTPLTEIDQALAEHGQYLPFDPPLAAQGATLGGTVAAGLSGPGRFRYGGVRDFIIGVRYINSEGELVHGGGNVVKNSAGFDLPKLMVGSLGMLGVLYELTFKVFPHPAGHLSLRKDFADLAQAVEWLYRLGRSALDLEALDLQPLPEGVALWARLGGLVEALPARLEAARLFLEGGVVVEGEAEAAFWQENRDFAWAPADWALVKVPLTPGHILPLEQALAPFVEAQRLLRRYSAGGQVAYLAAPEPLVQLGNLLAAAGLSGLVLLGCPGRVRLGQLNGEPFLQRIRQVMDPAQRFAEA